MTTTEPPHRSLDAQVQQARRRSVRYWFEDGLVDIVLGGGFVPMSLYFGVLAVIPHGAPCAMTGSLGLVIVGIGVLALRRDLREAPPPEGV